MKIEGQLEKWASAALGVVCVFLLWQLALSSKGVNAGASRPTLAPSGSRTARPLKAARPASPDDTAQYDAGLKLDRLEALEDRPLPPLERNPFEFPAPKAAMQPRVTPDQGMSPPNPEPAAVPAPIPFKAIGFAENAGGARQAVITDDEEEIYLVHEGEVFAKKFRVNKVSGTVVEIRDESTQQTIQLPIPQ